MQSRVRIAILVAVGSGLVTAYGVTNFLREQKAAVEAIRVSTQEVVVASRELPSGTTLASDMLRVVSYPRASLPAGYFASTDQVVGQTVGMKVVAGEPILESRFAEKIGALTALLQPGYRAMAVKVNEVIGVSGFIAPNDRVDVIANVEPESEKGKTSKVSKVVLQDKRVLSVAQAVERNEDGKPVMASSITLELTPEEAEKLSLATNGGEVLMALRGSDDRGIVQTRGSTTNDFLPPRRLATAKAVYQVVVTQGDKRSVASF
jgi:pilus assembly protein CpaB